MGWTPPRGLATEEARMNKVTTIGLDLAKNVFRCCCFSKAIEAQLFLQFFALQPPVHGCDGGLCRVALLGA
jgi:hypothetical protein